MSDEEKGSKGEITMTKDEILEHNKNYILWLDTLLELREEQAVSPYLPGKWSPNEIVMHLAEWDRFSSENRLPYMKPGARLEGFPEFEQFNSEAAGRANKHSFKETVEYAKAERVRLIEKLEQLGEEEWDNEFFIGEHSLSIKKYFTGFIAHDKHHKQQIESICENRD